MIQLQRCATNTTKLLLALATHTWSLVSQLERTLVCGTPNLRLVSRIANMMVTVPMHIILILFHTAKMESNSISVLPAPLLTPSNNVASPLANVVGTQA